MVQGKKQETNTGAKRKMPAHYRCTITCAFSGKRKHYEDKCYHKQRLSAKLKTKILAKALARAVARATATTLARASRKEEKVTAMSFLEGLIQAKPPLKPFC